ncbi:MAG: 50S ribosomal protein L22 [Magnetococcales bacterium]|nr:50S ribosomal protein L22 [Magnetococcales bacterium]
MEAIASTKNLRVSPTKVRPIVDQIRGMNVESALQVLQFSKKRASKYVHDTLKSAVANAEDTHGMDVDTLFVLRGFVDSGPTLKRFRPRARGRASRILKRTSHVTLVVTSKD